jgi:hypothetical protein
LPGIGPVTFHGEGSRYGPTCRTRRRTP